MTPFAMVLYWIFFYTFQAIGLEPTDIPPIITITTTTTIFAILVSIIPCGIVMLALRHLINLFRNYESGKIFTVENAKCFRKLGLLIYVWILGDIIYGVLLSVILTAHNRPGQREVTVSIHGIDFTILITGSIILAIAWVMIEGYKLSEEQAYTV